MIKRREFLIASASVAGAAAPSLAFGQAKPCPPPSISVAGGETATSVCVAAGDLEADWISRSTGPGVVWAHDFRSKAEVDQFRVASNWGNDQTDTHGSTVKYVTTDGITPGCLEISVPNGGTANGGWWRPMSAIRANDNGLATDDRGANGTLPRRAWNASSQQQNYTWRGGYYGHADYHTQYSTWQGNSNVWDGTDFYLQFRVKISTSRWTGYPGEPRNPFGKLMFIDCTGSTHESEIVIMAGGPDPQYFNSTYPFRMYTSSGSNANSFITSPQGAGTGSTMQSGGPYAGTCTIGGNTKVAGTCWEWPKAEEWITVLVHVIPGHDNIQYLGQPLSAWQYADQGIEVWVARAGATSYTKIFDNKQLKWLFGDRDGIGTTYSMHPPAFNSICPSAYMNNAPSIAAWYHRFDQIIFSKQMIACPQV